LRLTARAIAAADSEARPSTVVVEQGRIRAVEDWPGEAAAGLVVVPGLIDCHTHPLELGLSTIFPNLAGARSVADVQARLTDRAGQAADWDMMLGFNLEPDLLRERRYPRRAELDAVLPDVPVFLYRVDGHSAAANSVALNLLLSVLPGQRLPGLEMDCSGLPTGVLRGQAYERASRVFKHHLQPDQVWAALVSAGQEAARRGVTALGAFIGVEDTTREEFRVMLDALASGPVRGVPYLQTWDVHIPLEFGLKQAGGCLLIDGSFGSRTAALSRDYADARGQYGGLYVEDATLVSFLRACETAGQQTAVHAIGDRAVEQVLSCHEQARTSAGLRHRVEHAELLAPEHPARASRLGLVFGVQPAFEAEWGGPARMYASRLGERWQRTNRLRDLTDAGVRLAGGSDAPITPVDPIAGIRAAMNHPNTSQRLTGPEALAMFTTGAALALSLDSCCGELSQGRDADFTLLTADPRTDSDCRVVATFRAGRCIHRDENLTDLVKLED
jgi:predicted amidohydrolase YtcJ